MRSVAGLPSGEPERVARVDHRLRQGQGLVVVQAAEQRRHQERRGERVRDLSRRVSLDERANVVGRQSLAVPLRGHDRPRVSHAEAPIEGTLEDRPSPTSPRGRALRPPSASPSTARIVEVDISWTLDAHEVDEARPLESSAVGPEELGHRLSQIGEGVPRPDVVGPALQTRREERRPLAGVVGRRRRRVAAVIARDQQHAAVEGARSAPAASRRTPRRRPHSPGGSLRWPYLESKSTRFVKTNAGGGRAQVLDREVDPVVVGVGVPGFRDALAGEDVLDLPDAEDRDARILQPIEHRGARWGDGEVPPFGAPHEGPRFAFEGPGDHAPDAVRSGQEAPRRSATTRRAAAGPRPTCAWRSGTRSRRTCRRSAAWCAGAPHRARR